MNFRTDLAMENTPPEHHRHEQHGNCSVTRISEDGAEYVTIEVPAISDHIDSDNQLLSLLADELRALLPDGPVLAVGLGNRSITPDALGPAAAGQMLATRHIQGELARVTGLDGLRPVAVLAPGVLGCTGVEVSELLLALIHELKPASLIAVDALAARSLSRLGRTVQLSSGGISPGAGVGNARPGLNQKTLGVPVIAMGIPTVVDARTLAADLTGESGAQSKVSPRGAEMVVTPREIDLIIQRGARLLGMAANLALNPSLSVNDYELLV